MGRRFADYGYWGAGILALVAVVAVCVMGLSVNQPPPAGASQAAPLPPHPSAVLPTVHTSPALPVATRPPVQVPASGEPRAMVHTMLTATATWYGKWFDGRFTASGERFRMGGLTAAHPFLPFGTLLRVRNPQNGKSVVVRVTDRGAFTGNRIDLSYEAARQLAMIDSGAIKVYLEVLPVPAVVPTLRR